MESNIISFRTLVNKLNDWYKSKNFKEDDDLKFKIHDRYAGPIIREDRYEPIITFYSTDPEKLKPISQILDKYEFHHSWSKQHTYFKSELIKKPRFEIIWSSLKEECPTITEDDILHHGCEYLKTLLYKEYHHITVDFWHYESYYGDYQKSVDEITKL